MHPFRAQQAQRRKAKRLRAARKQLAKRRAAIKARKVKGEKRMITKEQAIALGRDHYGSTCIHYTGGHPCRRDVGPRGGIVDVVTRVRPSGQCRTWKRDPERFRLPVKYGLYQSGEITEQNADCWHRAEDCPAGINS